MKIDAQAVDLYVTQQKHSKATSEATSEEAKHTLEQDVVSLSGAKPLPEGNGGGIVPPNIENGGGIIPPK